nr:OprD family porin [Pseudomonas segetis]
MTVLPLGGLALLLLTLEARADITHQPRSAAWSLLSRNYFLHNDFRGSSPTGQSYQEEWAQGFIAEITSGFTPGTIGLGFDTHGFLGLKLDGGRGHAGTGLLPLDTDGRAADNYSSAGAALKLRLGQSLLRYGEMTVETPVFDTSDKRLQPEYATGFLFESRDFAELNIQAGRFTRFKNQNASSGRGDFTGYGASTQGSAISFVGASLENETPFGAALYASQLDETWRQAYLNLHFQQGALTLEGNLYKTRDQGEARVGEVDTLAYSLLTKYQVGSQAFTIAFQHVRGDTPFDFVGGDSIYLANSIKYADFNGPHERSWQARYDIELDAIGIPNLTFMARYVSGRGIDGSKAPSGGAYNPLSPVTGLPTPQQGSGGRHWERDLELRYSIPSGPAKDLTLNLSHVSHRGNDVQAADDIDRVYLILEYPLKGWL